MHVLVMKPTCHCSTKGNASKALGTAAHGHSPNKWWDGFIPRQVFSELYAKHLTPGTFCGYLEPSDHHFLPQIVLMDLQGII
jgi:hypothetical protein